MADFGSVAEGSTINRPWHQLDLRGGDPRHQRRLDVSDIAGAFDTDFLSAGPMIWVGGRISGGSTPEKSNESGRLSALHFFALFLLTTGAQLCILAGAYKNWVMSAMGRLSLAWIFT